MLERVRRWLGVGRGGTMPPMGARVEWGPDGVGRMPVRVCRSDGTEAWGWATLTPVPAEERP